jgi:hypothetical protein
MNKNPLGFGTEEFQTWLDCCFDFERGKRANISHSCVDFGKDKEPLP